jgi:hypothetical protein
MMNLEWLIRHDPSFVSHARTYLFTQGPITEIEESATGKGAADGSAAPPATSLGIGSLKEGR